MALPFKKSGIYKIINILNGLPYIGSAVDIGNRWSSHKKDLKKNIHANQYLQRAWNKYGEESFKFEIIELVNDKTKIIEREQYWMDYHKSYERDKGYNINPKAESCLGVKKGPSPLKGIKRLKPESEETKSKKRLAKLGVAHPRVEGQQDKIALAQMLKNHTFEEIQFEDRLCACGCGETFNIRKYKKQQYIAYHAARGRKTWNTGLTIEDPRVKDLAEKSAKANTGKKHKKVTKFCPKGHDKDVVGRNKNYSCVKCVYERAVEIRKRIKDGTHIVQHKKQFCINGHDTFLVGRYKGGACIKCTQIRALEYDRKEKMVGNI